MTFLAHASLPLRYWDKAIRTLVFLINRLSSSVLSGQIPLQVLFKQQPNYSMMKVFSCSYFPNLRPYNNPKFQFRSVECTFLGYSIKHKGFKCLDPQGRIYISKDVQFNEKSSHFAKTKSTTCLSSIPSPTPTFHSALIPIHSPILSVLSPSTSFITNTVADQSNYDQTSAKSVSNVSRNVHSMRTRSKAGIFKPKVFIASKEPASIQEALLQDHWKAAMAEEYSTLVKK